MSFCSIVYRNDDYFWQQTLHETIFCQNKLVTHIDIFML